MCEWPGGPGRRGLLLQYALSWGGWPAWRQAGQWVFVWRPQPRQGFGGRGGPILGFWGLGIVVVWMGCYGCRVMWLAWMLGVI